MDGEDQENESSEEVGKVKESKEEVIFWARASLCSLGRWVEEEIIGSGKIIVPDQSLKFANHIKVASSEKKNPKGISEIDFIRASSSFINGDIVECEDMAQARAFTEQQARVKGTRPNEVESVTSTARQ